MAETATDPSSRAPLRLSEEELVALVERIANGDPHSLLPAGDVRRWGLAYATDEVEAWVIAWPPGSGLGMHDHDGSTAAVRVIDGRLRERYVGADGEVVLRWLGGRTTVLPDDHVHEVINTEVIEAVSIHAYSPPVAEMGFRDDPALDVTTRG